MLAAVAQNRFALKYATAELKGDREIVLAAMAQDGSALKYATAELRRHRALGWIRTTNVALHCAKLRLALEPLGFAEGRDGAYRQVHIA
eukprot:COSAG02_NODE_2085_length_9885_cov_9.743946_6_plen_89_part_00